MKLTKVKMTATQRGSINGINIELYRKGQIYDLPESLYTVFKKNKWCEDYQEGPPTGDIPKAKSAGSSPQNKSMGNAPKNKDNKRK